MTLTQCGFGPARFKELVDNATQSRFPVANFQGVLVLNGGHDNNSYLGFSYKELKNDSDKVKSFMRYYDILVENRDVKSGISLTP